MTGRELEVIIHLARSGGRSGLREIADRLGVSLGYARLLCAALYARYYVEKHQGEVFVLTRTGQAAAAGRHEPAGGPVVSPLSPAVDQTLVDSVAQTLTSEVQRTLQRQLRRGESARLPQEEPIAIQTGFADLLPDATGSLETNLEGAPQEAVSGGAVHAQARALRALRGARGT